MITEIIMSEEQLIRQVTNVLIDKLGITETARFFTIHYPAHKDAVARHRLWQNSLNKDDFFEEIFNERKN
jgi:hypothetical protein